LRFVNNGAVWNFINVTFSFFAQEYIKVNIHLFALSWWLGDLKADRRGKLLLFVRQKLNIALWLVCCWRTNNLFLNVSHSPQKKLSETK
jgi:hypothetical protein